MTVVAFVTAAMITVLSAFNGIEDLVHQLFSNFDAALTIVPKEGKSFADSLVRDDQLASFSDLERWSRIIEEDAWLQYGDYNTVTTVKGVADDYAALSPIDSMMYFGSFDLKRDSVNYAVVGIGVLSELRLPRPDREPPIMGINAPIRGKRLSRFKERAFNRTNVMVSGAFSVNAELDVKYTFVPISFARALFGMEEEITAIELLPKADTDIDQLKKNLESSIPSSLTIQTRYDRNALVYKTNASEKWFTFLILFFILLIASFNIIASLTMLIIEKKKDIYILESMGLSRSGIERVFVLEGFFINILGAVIGTIVGLALCFAQIKFGLVTMEGAMVDYYPISVDWLDVIGIFATVVVIGGLFSFGLVSTLMRRFAWK